MNSRSDPTFSLTKWYLDTTDDQGRSAIAYWARVVWGPLAVRWAGLIRHGEAAAPRQRSTIAGGEPPAWSNGVLGWQNDALGCRIECEPWSAPFESTLLDSADGSIEWSCQAPGATVTLRDADGSVIRGAGYAERIVLTVVPWHLPITELRWGRWLCPRTRRSLVWIDWRGNHPLTIVLDGGRPRGLPAVGDDDVWFAADAAGASFDRLRLDQHVTLHTRPLSEVLGGLRPLAARLPASWLTLEDRKTRSLGTLDEGGGAPPEEGWAIHEVFLFPHGRRSS